MSGSVLWSIGSPWNSYGLDALGSCITPDVSAAVPGQGQALDISFPEENIPMRVQRSSVFVLFYYTPSDETKNFGIPIPRITTATDSKCTKIGVSHCSDPGPPGSGSGHGYLPLPSFYAPGNLPSRSSTQPTTGPLNLLFLHTDHTPPSPSLTHSSIFFRSVQAAV